VLHPAWDESWPTPTAHDIDDLEDHGFLRVRPATNLDREFTITPSGRQQAEVLARPRRSYAGGRVAPIDQVLDWLLELESTVPDVFEPPERLLDHAVEEGFIEETGREALADTLVRLHDEGYLRGNVPYFEEATAEDRISMTDALRPTIRARDRARERAGSSQAPSVAFYAPVVAHQIAAGDIANYATFMVLLDRAAEELESLEDVDDATRDEAEGLLDLLRGKAAGTTGRVFTGASGALLASLLGRLIGLPT
jgi:DNA-binding PadR family transcriptional regulator